MGEGCSAPFWGGGLGLHLTQGHSPQFSAHISCGQMAAWIKMSLGMELGLAPSDFVLDGDPAPFPKKGDSRYKLVLGMVVGLSPGD